MLSDIIRQSGISLSNIPNVTSKSYGDSGVVSSAGVISTLDSITFPTDAFASDGDFMSFEYWGSFFGDADTQLNLDVVSDHVFTSGIQDPGSEGWLLHGKMIRYTTSDLPMLRTLGTLIGQTFQVIDTSSAAIQITPGGSMTLVLKGGGTSASSVVVYGAFRQFYFQNR